MARGAEGNDESDSASEGDADDNGEEDPWDTPGEKKTEREPGNNSCCWFQRCMKAQVFVMSVWVECVAVMT